MGMDPSQCDKATIQLFRDKFFGSDAQEKKSKSSKSKTKKKAKKPDMENEDNDTLLINTKEADIHLAKAHMAGRHNKATKNHEGAIQKAGAVV